MCQHTHPSPDALCFFRISQPFPIQKAFTTSKGKLSAVFDRVYQVHRIPLSIHIMTPSNHDAIDLSYFRPYTNPLSDTEPILPNRCPQMIWLIIAGYFLFYFYTYMLFKQITRRNRSCRQARDGKKGLSVEFEEEVLVVEVQGSTIGEGGNGGWEVVGKRRLKV